MQDSTTKTAAGGRLPTFGPDTIETLMRARVRTTIEAIVQEELDAALGAEKSARVGETRQGYGVVARIVTGPHEAHRQDSYLPMRYDTGRPRAVIRFKISQPRTTSLPCPAELRARRPSPMMDL